MAPVSFVARMWGAKVDLCPDLQPLPYCVVPTAFLKRSSGNSAVPSLFWRRVWGYHVADQWLEVASARRDNTAPPPTIGQQARCRSLAGWPAQLRTITATVLLLIKRYHMRRDSGYRTAEPTGAATVRATPCPLTRRLARGRPLARINSTRRTFCVAMVNFK